MPVASTGFVRASGYADKLRRVLFAQLKDHIKAGVIDQKQVAYRAGRINEALYKVLVEILGVKKEDVVRIQIPYEVKDGDLHVDWDNVSIEIYLYNPELSARSREELKKIIEGGLIDIDFRFKEAGREGPTLFYDVYVNNEKVGKVAVVDMGSNYAASGAVIIRGKAYRIGGLIAKTENVDVALRRLVNEAIIENREMSIEEAEKIIG